MQRERSVKDRRVVHVDLTTQGRQLVLNSPEVAQGMLVKGLESITPDKLLKISEGLAELVRILGVQKSPPKLIGSNQLNIPSRRKSVAEPA